MKKLQDLEGKEAKQAIKDFEEMFFENFEKKYKDKIEKYVPYGVVSIGKVIDKLKEKVKQ